MFERQSRWSVCWTSTYRVGQSGRQEYRSNLQEYRSYWYAEPHQDGLALAIITFAAAFPLHWALGGQLGYSVSLPQMADGTQPWPSAWLGGALRRAACALPALPCFALACAGWPLGSANLTTLDPLDFVVRRCGIRGSNLDPEPLCRLLQKSAHDPLRRVRYAPLQPALLVLGLLTLSQAIK